MMFFLDEPLLVVDSTQSYGELKYKKNATQDFLDFALKTFWK